MLVDVTERNGKILPIHLFQQLLPLNLLCTKVHLSFPYSLPTTFFSLESIGRSVHNYVHRIIEIKCS
jgi:hypothetical protein